MLVTAVARIRDSAGGRGREIGKEDGDIVKVARVVRVRRYTEAVRRGRGIIAAALSAPLQADYRWPGDQRYTKTD
jgi:hypothetical protein